MNEEKTTKSFLILYKTKGKFYNIYGIDSYIMHNLFGYKVMDDQKCGFPDNSINKVENKLLELKISYQIVTKGKDPIVKDFKKLNNYNKYYKEALDKMDSIKKIELIKERISSLSSEKIDKLMNMISEFTC